MKETDFLKPIDQVGRIVVPKELRDSLKWKSGDLIRFYTDGSSITLKKTAPCCVFCGGADELRCLRGTCICRSCAEELIGRFSDREE